MNKITSSVYDIVLEDLQGCEVELSKFRGKCLLVVNIASQCKLMKENFVRLRELKRKFSNDLVILLVPCQQFMGMPESDPAEIVSFLKRENVDFAECFATVDVNGSDAHPLYTFLKSERPGCISWNFTKFLVDKSGYEVERFNHRALFAAIEGEIRKII